MVNTRPRNETSGILSLRQNPLNRLDESRAHRDSSARMRKSIASPQKPTNAFQVLGAAGFLRSPTEATSGVSNVMAESALLESAGSVFIERRQRDPDTSPAVAERRQFRDGSRSDRPDVAELANTIDDYKVANRRRFITFEELFDVMISLGYHK